jgi:cytosine/adenosine deaminase-related metal-dependent hydrolase
MDFMSRIVRASAEDPASIESADILRMATVGGAAAVGISERTGAIAEGLDADIVLVDLNGRLKGTHDIYSALVHRAGPEDVAATIKKGVFMHDSGRIRRLK